MYLGIFLFGLGGLVLIGAYLTMITKRREREETLLPEDRLTDEQFRKIEYGDEE